MHLREALCIAPEVSAALRSEKPVVALPSNGLTRGVEAMEHLRARGVVPAITAVLKGVLHIGLSKAQWEALCALGEIPAVSRRDMPIAVATGASAPTTVAAAMMLACVGGIPVVAARTVGGVTGPLAVSPDLQELRQTPVAVVCAGLSAKADAPATQGYLKTIGVPVLGLQTETFAQGQAVDYTAANAAMIGRILETKWGLGFKGGALIACQWKDSTMQENVLEAAAQIAIAYAKQASR